VDLFEQIERGEAIYGVVKNDGTTEELFFAGYSLIEPHGASGSASVSFRVCR
jgi:hypothetical protein